MIFGALIACMPDGGAQAAFGLIIG